MLTDYAIILLQMQIKQTRYYHIKSNHLLCLTSLQFLSCAFSLSFFFFMFCEIKPQIGLITILVEVFKKQDYLLGYIYDLYILHLSTCLPIFNKPSTFQMFTLLILAILSILFSKMYLK